MLLLEVDVETNCEDVVVTGIVRRVVQASVCCELYRFGSLLVLIECVEVSHVEIHLLVDVINTTDGNRIGTYNE